MSSDSNANQAAFSTGGGAHLMLHAPLNINFQPYITQGITVRAQFSAFSVSLRDFVTGAGGLFDGLTPNQSRKIAWYMNEFQEFRFTKVNYRYRPRWQLASQFQGAITAGQVTGGEYYPAPVSTDTNGCSGSAQNDKTVIILADKTDLSNASSSGATSLQSTQVFITDAQLAGLDEMWVAMTMPNAHVFSARNRNDGGFMPHTMAPTMTYANNAQVNVNNITGSSASEAADAPVPVPWKATRCSQFNNSSQQNVDTTLNLLAQDLGLKIWVYDPYNTSTGCEPTYAIGQLWLEYHFEFRNREFRQPITGLTFTNYDAQEAEEIQKKLAVLHGMKRPRTLDDALGLKFKRQTESSSSTASPRNLVSPPQTPQATFLARKK